MIILLHSSKTMVPPASPAGSLTTPILLEKAARLDAYLKTLSAEQLARAMSLSPALAEKTHALIAAWTPGPEGLSAAVDTFKGDIYSGLQASELSAADRAYANESLFILSGLYGVLLPDDGICPYRLEMGYKLPDPHFASLYDFWGEDIASRLPEEGPIANLAADEYSRTVTRFVDPQRVITPRFLTVSPKTGKPAFVVVHAKIARGAFARWLITHKVRDPAQLEDFAEIGYRYEADLSQPAEPVFVCEEFGGKGLSVRLK
jgi:uncharacterized protein